MVRNILDRSIKVTFSVFIIIITSQVVTGEIPNGHGVSYYHEDPEAIQYEGNLSPLTSHFSPLSSRLTSGDWEAGKQTGRGKFFYLSGAVKFHGNLTDSLAEGRGCFYYEDGSLMFDGDFKQGKFHRGKLLTTGKYLTDNYKLHIQN